MINTQFLIFSLTAYLLGSIPSAVWFGKLFYGIDVREHGSGNAGATNTLRVLGNKPGFIVLSIDLLKGFLAANLVVFLKDLEPDTNAYLLYQIAFGALAVIGHVFPVFAQFKGGKGIATLLGITIALNGMLALICAALFVVIVYITRYISVGSMLSAIASPFIAFGLYHAEINALVYFCAIVALLVVYTHRANIKRLTNGNENKFSFTRKQVDGKS
jgi:glycerol-3-phosphate acyltransferase PlsY